MIKVNVFFNEYKDRIPLLSGNIKYIVDCIIGDRKINNAEVSIIFVDDKYITELNRKYLKKDNPTDVISFKLNENRENLEGEVYISIDTAVVQAEDYKVKLEEELVRLIVHGILHLAGYNDLEEKEKILMKNKENYYINLYKNKKLN
ncbi:rRNA maturation RNase YbeY [candidate division KSB1 bacterium]|nr:MAG: rRNA maturation RNase YbeY [candidate division KSB1 bacterium]